MFTLLLNTDTRAFHADDGTETEAARGAEIARILRHVAYQIGMGAVEGACLDLNGKTVGRYVLESSLGGAARAHQCGAVLATKE
jgi:hypothetical protein